MHPATSIILFTVASGAGFGLITLLGVSAMFGAVPQGAYFWVSFVLAFALTGGGLISSTMHLGHPERAWRAMSQWRSSWLSREGVAAIATLAFTAAFALSCLVAPDFAAILGLWSALAALTTVYTTSMIYAQLKTVDRWHMPLTPVVFLAFSLASGTILLAALRAALTEGGAGFWPLIAAVAIFAAWSLRQSAWKQGDTKAPTSTPETATGLGGMGRVRLFESPHTGGNYLLHEMGFQVARRHAGNLRLIALGLGGLIPMLATLAASSGMLPPLMLILGALSFLAGLLVERWLFFAEARHAVMAYYDRRAA